MEEWVGQKWHHFITQRASLEHRDAAVMLKDTSGQLALLFRAFGGDPVVEIKAAVARDWHGKRTWLSRLAQSSENVELASLRGDSLYLPSRIAVFANSSLNRELYIWLTATLAVNSYYHDNSDDQFAVHDWLQRGQRATAQTLHRLPGLKKCYARLCEAYLAERATYPGCALNPHEKILREALLHPSRLIDDQLDPLQLLPVALWPDPRPALIENRRSSRQPDADHQTENNADPSRQQRQLKLQHSKRGEFVEQIDEKSGLMAFRLESVFSWAEFIPVDRTADEDELEDAAAAVADIDTISLSRDGQQTAGKLKFDLDLPAADEDDLIVQSGIPLPEWDYRKSQLVEDYCRLQVMQPRQSQPHPIPDTLRAKARKLKAQFETLALGKQWLRGQPDGSELDLDRWILQRADRAHGHTTGDENLYLELRQNLRDLSCLLLADLSLSTDSYVNNDARVIDIIKDSLYLFSEALSVTQDRYAIAAFNSKKRDGVRYYDIKSFEQRANQITYDRIQALRPNCYTRMGAAIRHACDNLQRQPTGTRLLLLISDGKPNDLDIYEGRYGVEDTRHAVKQARQQGIKVFCITIDDEDHDYLGYIFGANQYIRIKHAVELPEKLPKLYHMLTG